jgi:hypothetical protein
MNSAITSSDRLELADAVARVATWRRDHAPQRHGAAACRRALLAAITFGAYGVVSVLMRRPDESIALPLGLAYALLVLNTYYSVRCFSPLSARGGRRQWWIDGALVVAYAALAANLGNPRAFMLGAALLFTVATLKYVELVEAGGSHAALIPKLRVDVAGILFCLGGLALVIAGHAHAAAWVMAGVSAAANLYLVCVRPLYRPLP